MNESSFEAAASAGLVGLGPAVITRLVIAGAVGWAMAALFIRYANGAGLFHGITEIGLFALCLPLAWGTAFLLRVGGRLRPEQLVPAMAIGLMTALFLDGVALTAVPWIYGAAEEALLPAAAWLLFGVGAFLAAAFLERERG